MASIDDDPIEDWSSNPMSNRIEGFSEASGEEPNECLEVDSLSCASTGSCEDIEDPPCFEDFSANLTM
eukprot:5656411-Amphidinium_carterae.1